ncbi:regulatory protein, tetR family [Saccharopolyspora antimicrobica]|uniref:Regulatory protein, tetR family n=1 Tax=Saccharopolyspora antimicrobica TaxID=455193 RepID=A0A1I5C3A8_9PSEU|nr:TetR/AcrR family transcriptional regulator C-terminal domain-containing protein [Saccharopolyspora antimicrobica]RKT88985.1 TetR family transcriptional regulator [Saccharopolyspora antimicrobica]SFN81458.1 regulatory protein, tetR family [Saccharopolyspora antimicrobica]
MLLRKANVVDGAMRFLDAEGLDALTMRKLGATLNVQGGALYRHFPNKEALLDAMADKILEGVAGSLPDVAWDEQIFVLCDRLRTSMLAHRDGARVVSGTYSPGVNTIAGTDTAIQILCRAGAAPAQAGWLTFALFYYVLGHTIEEQALGELPADDDWRSRNARHAVDASAEYAAALDSLTSTDPAKRFAYGLRTFLDGIAGQIVPDQARPHQTIG